MVGERGGDVEAREHVAARGDRFAARDGGVGQRFEMRQLGGDGVNARLRHAARRLVQIRRVEADDPRERLAVGKARFGCHQRIGMFRRHLDMIAEHAVVADLERGDAGAVAILRLQRGNRLAPVARGFAQRVERMIIALGDIAALRRIDRRRFDQRAGQLVDERAMTVESRQQPREQRRQAGTLRQALAQQPRAAQRIAKLGEVARPPAPRDEAAERTPRVGQRAERGAEIAAPQRIARETVDKVEPVEDRGLVGERAREIVGEQARARRGHRAVDRAEQAAIARARHGADEFEAFARRGVDRHAARRLMPERRLEEDRLAGADMVEIGDERAHRGEFATAELTETIERLDAEKAFEAFLRGRARKFGLRAPHDLPRDPRGDVFGIFADEQFGRREPREFGVDLFGAHRDDLEPPGRDVGGGDRDLALAADLRERGEAIRAAPFEQRLLGQRARGDEAHDVARDEGLRPAARLGLGGGFDLFGDRDAVPRLDQPREVGFGRMNGHAAHRHRFAAMLAARRQGDVERRGGRLRIVEEEFEEIAHAIEQQAIARLRLQRPILRHHRGGGGRDIAVGGGTGGSGHRTLLSDWGRHGKARVRR